MENLSEGTPVNGIAAIEVEPNQFDKAYSAIMHLTLLLSFIYWPVSWVLCVPLLMWAFGSSSDFINRQGRGL